MMLEMVLTVLLFNGLSSTVLGETSCYSPLFSQDIKFSLTSRRNETGHWIAQLQLQRGDASEIGTSSPVSIDIEHNISSCGNSASIQVLATITAPPRGPQPGYELYPGLGYYKFHSKSAVWDEALRICAQEGAHLAIINSKEESLVLGELVRRHPKLVDTVHQSTAFLGFHDKIEEGNYFTIFGEPLNSTGFSIWAQNQPDNAGGNPGEDCGSVLVNGLLNDLPCGAKEAFICEQQIW